MTVRVAQIIGSRGGGGAERFYVRLTAALHAAGTPVLAVLPPGSYVDHELPPEVPRARIPMRGVWDLQARWRIRRALRRFGADVAQTWMGRATRLTRLAAGARPVHVARLGGYYDVKGYRHAHAWVANTRGIRDHLVAHGLPAGRVFHIGNFVEPFEPAGPETVHRAKADLGIPPQALVVLALGRLHPNKGFLDLLDAFARLPARQDGRPVHLLLIGGGPLRTEIHRAAGRSPAAARIHLLDWVRDTAPYYAAADLLVCPSRHEPLGNVILEAWAHGLPVVSTATAGPSELIRDGETGRLVPVADPEALADAIRDLLADGYRRRSLARRGRETVLSEHGREAVLTAYLALYRHLAEHPSLPPPQGSCPCAE